ncbi:MAG: penicillin acylase family protein, partial [Gammaproteobacteria bacterium]
MCKSKVLAACIVAAIGLAGCNSRSPGAATSPTPTPGATPTPTPAATPTPTPGATPTPTPTGGTGISLDDGPNLFMAIVPPGANGNSAGAVGGPLPGQPQLVYPQNYRDQLDLYGNLAHAKSPLISAPCVPPASIDEHEAQSDDACNYFKRARLTLPDAEAVSTVALTAPNGKAVVIRRDGWGVPYIDGADRGAAQFGLGYAAAQDRLWLFDLLRAVGRGRASEKLGPSPTTYGLDVEFAADSAYSEAEISGIVDNAVAKIGEPLGPLFLQDVQLFVAGMNAYVDFLLTPQGLAEIPLEYSTLALGVGSGASFPPEPFTVNDIVANAVLIQSALGLGGGGEARNLRLLQTLDPSITGGTTLLPQAACELWRDLRHANAADTTHSASGTFATQSPPSVDESCPQTLPAGTAIWDVGSFRGHVLQRAAAGSPVIMAATQPQAALKTLLRSGLPQAAGPHPPLRDAVNAAPRQLAVSEDPGASRMQFLNRHGLPLTSSNWIAVAAGETQSGHPILVGGPQTGYFVPQLLWEAAVVSRGGTPYELAARGISTVNLPYLVIGRGIDFAWSPTSAGSDFTDTRVSRLCNTDGTPPSRDDADGDGFPDADGYRYKGRCVRLYRRIDTWTAAPTAASLALGGPPQPEVVTRYVLRTHYGAVSGTATVGGEPVVVSRQRSTFLA